MGGCYSPWSDPSSGRLAINTMMLASRPRDPHMGAVVAQIVSNIQSHSYGAGVLHVTGPGAFSEALGWGKDSDFDGSDGVRIRCQHQGDKFVAVGPEHNGAEVKVIAK